MHNERPRFIDELAQISIKLYLTFDTLTTFDFIGTASRLLHTTKEMYCEILSRKLPQTG